MGGLFCLKARAIFLRAGMCVRRKIDGRYSEDIGGFGGGGAIIGHNWPLYFGFRGGKGALTAVAVLFMFDWVMALICLGLFAVIVAFTRYVSLGTICAAMFFVALSFVPTFAHTFWFHIFACLMAGIIIFKHRENVRRLLSGTENRLVF